MQKIFDSNSNNNQTLSNIFESNLINKIIIDFIDIFR